MWLTTDCVWCNSHTTPTFSQYYREAPHNLPSCTSCLWPQHNPWYIGHVLYHNLCELLLQYYLLQDYKRLHLLISAGKCRSHFLELLLIPTHGHQCKGVCTSCKWKRNTLTILYHMSPICWLMPFTYITRHFQLLHGLGLGLRLLLRATFVNSQVTQDSEEVE